MYGLRLRCPYRFPILTFGVEQPGTSSNWGGDFQEAVSAEVSRKRTAGELAVVPAGKRLDVKDEALVVFKGLRFRV